MTSSRHPPESGAPSKFILILAIVLLQMLILLLVIAMIYLSGGIRGGDSADLNSTWTAWP